MASRSTSAAIPVASHPTDARALRYFTRATTSRAAPMYSSSAAQRSTPAGGGSAGARRMVAMHPAHGDGPTAPHAAHRPGINMHTTLRRASDTLLGDQRGDQRRGGDVEGGVVGGGGGG